MSTTKFQYLLCPLICASVMPSCSCFVSQVVTVDELRDDNEYEEILEDMRDECRKFGECFQCIFGHSWNNFPAYRAIVICTVFSYPFSSPNYVAKPVLVEKSEAYLHLTVTILFSSQLDFISVFLDAIAEVLSVNYLNICKRMCNNCLFRWSSQTQLIIDPRGCRLIAIWRKDLVFLD